MNKTVANSAMQGAASDLMTAPYREMIVEFIFVPDYIEDERNKEAQSPSYRVNMGKPEERAIIAKRIRYALDSGLIVSSRKCRET